jgi:hypothetical protein
MKMLIRAQSPSSIALTNNTYSFALGVGVDLKRGMDALGERRRKIATRPSNSSFVTHETCWSADVALSPVARERRGPLGRKTRGNNGEREIRRPKEGGGTVGASAQSYKGSNAGLPRP